MRLFERFIQSRFAIILLPISWIWGLVCLLRHTCYDKGLFAVHKVDVPVVSVGNIAVGGRGKTPLVILLGEIFASYKVAIISRGYGGGDEMEVIKRHLPNALLYANPNRVISAKKAVEDGADLILMDDGFQHRRLHRDFDLVLVQPQDLKGRYLPAGQLRDSKRRLSKATVIHTLETKASCSVELAGERVAIFCGIGSPERFKKTVTELGAIIVHELYLADHEPIGSARLHTFYNQASVMGIKYLVCTEKDEVKLPEHHLPIVSVRIETTPGGLENLIEKIKERLDN